MHLYNITFCRLGFDGGTNGGSRFWVWGRREDGTVFYLIWVFISLVLFPFRIVLFRRCLPQAWCVGVDLVVCCQI